ncbi:MAG: cytochrome c oxidase assembly protein [Burkholderiales bacterium]|nr:cytochrome c oxidase assembly protein [Burkholderiales bacterium]
MTTAADLASEATNRVTLRKLVVIVVVMFGFGFALVPFYDKICQATGIRNLLNPDEVSAANTQVDLSRTVTIEFDASIRQLPWDFKPEVVSIKAHPGQLVNVMYDISNTTGREMAGQAIPSYAPRVAAQYFHKLDCFCFSKQTLGPHESRRMPVVFVVDPNLPADVHTITLSYTFFEINGATAEQKG